MVDVSIHQEDTAVQRTPLIDIVISMVTEKTTSTPTPPTTQAQVTNKVEAMPKRGWTEKDQQRTDEMLKMIDNLLLERQIMRSLESLVGGRNIETDKRLLPRTAITDTLEAFPNDKWKSKTSANINKPCSTPSVKSFQDEAFQGRLFDSFQYKEKYEHVGLKVTRLQEDKRIQDDEEITFD
ncbi:hypothetical protein Tco_1146316 [Tanacetum coccineum]